MSCRRRDSIEIIDLTEEPAESEGDTTTTEQESSSPSSQIIVQVEGIPFTEREHRILLDPHQWLTDAIINAYGARLASRYEHLHCCSTFFFTRINERFEEDWLSRWKATLRPNLRLLLVPINWNNSHWALAAYNLQAGSLSYYDSMMSPVEGENALSLLKKAFEACKLLPSSISGDDKVRTVEGRDDAVGVLAFILSKLKVANGNDKGTEPKSITVRIPPRQAQQIDSSSCGVYVCWRMRLLAEGEENEAAERLKSTTDFRKEILTTIKGN